MKKTWTLVLCAWALLSDAETINAMKSGADPSGKTLCTAKIQAAIDQVSASGGGKVVVPKGVYKVTALRLKNGVTLHLDDGAILWPSRESSDYGEERLPIVGAEDASDIAVAGNGVIEGGGDYFYGADGVAPKISRPHYILHFKRCKRLKVEDVTLRYSMHWTCRLDCCEDLVVRGITIRNRCFSQQNCSDGIDLVCCKRALIEKCDIETGDDGICLKSELGKSIPADKHPVMSDITVRDCVIATTCNATKIGTETVGDIQNVLFERITVRKHSNVVGKNPIPSGVCIAAISLQSNDGAKVSNITCRDYTIEDCYAPVFIQLQDRDSHRPSDLGSLGNIVIERLTCKRSIAASQINVSAGGRIGRVTLIDFDVRTQEVIEKKPGSPKRPVGKYPEADHNGVMPAYGLFARDVDGLTLSGKMVFRDEAGSGRKALVFEDVKDLNNTGEDTFTLAIIPDAQLETSGTRFEDRLKWLANNRDTLNLKMVLLCGDLMNFNDDAQYAHQSKGLEVLNNAHLPFAAALGNHDTAAVKVDGGSAAPGNVNTNLRNTTKFNAYFPTNRFALLSGTYEEGKIDNAYHTFTAGGLKWLVINLELWARTDAVEWAKTVVTNHPNHNIIILTHAHLNSDSSIQKNNGGYGNNSPQFIFDQLMNPYANVRLVFSGHVGTHGHRTDTGVKGNTIYQFLQCYHDNKTNPTLLLEINTKNGTMTTRVHCPSIKEDKHDGSSRTITGVQWVKP